MNGRGFCVGGRKSTYVGRAYAAYVWFPVSTRHLNRYKHMASASAFLDLYDDPPETPVPPTKGDAGGRIVGRAKVAPGVSVTEDARIGGYAIVHGGVFKGHARIGGFAVIHGGEWNGTEGPIYEGEWLAPGQPSRRSP